jgi:hypothetical protein
MCAILHFVPYKKHILDTVPLSRDRRKRPSEFQQLTCLPPGGGGGLFARAVHCTVYIHYLNR